MVVTQRPVDASRAPPLQRVAPHQIKRYVRGQKWCFDRAAILGVFMAGPKYGAAPTGQSASERFPVTGENLERVSGDRLASEEALYQFEAHFNANAGFLFRLDTFGERG